MTDTPSTEEKVPEEAMEALREAPDLVADWGSYASAYFQDKWDLDGDVRRLREAVAALAHALSEQDGEGGDHAS